MISVPDLATLQTGTAALQSRILAAIDVGTNSIHMVLARIQPDLPSFDIIAAEKEMVRLGDRDPVSGDLTPAAMERAHGALSRCLKLARSYEAEAIIAVATSAVREAPNGHEFLERIQRELGLEIDLISGPEEARRIYLGVLSGMPFQGRLHAIVDIGGGSTELILGDSDDPRCLTSTKIGAVRLAREFVTTDPISPEEYNFLRIFIRGSLDLAVSELRGAYGSEAPVLVGTSGTAQAMAAYHAYRRNPLQTPSTLNGYEFSREDLRTMLAELRAMNLEQRRLIPVLSERRAEIIVPGAMILLETMEMLGCDRLHTCERALREGVIVDWMLSHGLIADRMRYQGQIRERSVLSQARKFGVDIVQSDRVAELALGLFDQLRGVLHTWDEGDRQLLWAAALLHACGHYISHAAHHKHAYYLIRHCELLGYNETEIEVIANVARYHRKSGPKKKHEGYRNLPTKEHRRRVEQLGALLRMAVAAGRRRSRAVEAISCHYERLSHHLQLTVQPCDPQDDCALELWTLEMNRPELERSFGVSCSIRHAAP